jgi:hypothetical protein
VSHWQGRHHKGFKRVVKALKREEGAVRNAATPPERRKAHRRSLRVQGIEIGDIKWDIK